MLVLIWIILRFRAGIKYQHLPLTEPNKLKEIYSNILNEDSYMHYIQIHKEFVDSALKSGLPSVGIYKLVEEPFKLKPFEQFMEDKKKEIFKGLFYLE